VHRPRALCDKGSPHDEFEFLKATLGESGCSIIHIIHALNPEVRTTKPRDKPTSVALLPHVQTTYGRIRRMSHSRIRIVDLPLRKFSSFLRPVEDELRLETPRAYSIFYECGQVYIGQTGQSIKPRIKQHYQHIPIG
jgi:hypothetical protein